MRNNIFMCDISVLNRFYRLFISLKQTYIQSKTEELVKIEDSRRKKRRTRINEKHMLIKDWMSSHGLPDDMKTKIMDNIDKDNLERFINHDVDINFIRYVYFGGLPIEIMEFVCVQALKRVSLFPQSVCFINILLIK